MERHLIDYIRRPELMDMQSVAHLRDLVEKYPYFHAARILLLKSLYQLHDPMFDKELRKAAIMVPCRKSLFHLIEEKNYTPQPEKRRSVAAIRRENSSQDLTGSLIDTFLSNMEQDIPQPRHQHPIDATQDYIGYLMQNEKQGKTSDTPMNGDGLIENFLSKDNGRIVLSDKENEPDETPNMAQENDTPNEIFTETLARIYIKQGNFERAIEIIRRLSLKYPKKNRYFADQIRFMEKILINNKNK